MAWNGSGTFNRKHNWTQEAALGTPMLPANFDDDANDMAETGFGNCMTRDGQGGAAANIPFNGYRITLLGTPTASTDAATKGYIDTPTADRSMAGYKLTNLADPVNPQDAATKAYVGGTTTQLPDQTGKTDYVLTANAGGAGVAGWGNSINATVVKFRDGTDATKLLAFDLSAITTGTTRTIVWPDKGGTAATTADIAMVLLATVTPTAAAVIDFLSSFSGTYDRYMIVGEGLTNNAGASTDQLSLRFANAGAVDSGSKYFYTFNGTVTLAATGIAFSGAVLGTGKGVSFNAMVLNANDTTNLKTATFTAVSESAATPAYFHQQYGAAYDSANAVSGFRLYWLSGSSFAATGKVRLYGIINS